MSFSKGDLFDPKAHHFSLLCKALSHPARIVMLQRLLDHQYDRDITASFLIDGLPLAESTLFQHLRYLRDMNILESRYKGEEVIYTLNEEMPDTYIEIIYMIWNSAKLPYSEIRPQVKKLYKEVKSIV